MGRTVTLKVRFADFTTITRSRTLRDPTDVSREIYAAATALFDALGLQRARIRLVGVRMEGLVQAEQAAVQPRLDEPDFGWRDADRAVDRASARFGAGAVRPAALVRGEPVARPGSMPRPQAGSPVAASGGARVAPGRDPREAGRPAHRRDPSEPPDASATATPDPDLS
jgi:DNA polymerase-4